MKSSLRLIAFAVFALFIGTAARAAAESKYLAGTMPDFLHLIPPPPITGSAEAKAELEYVSSLHQAAPAADIARGKDENKFTVFHFAPIIGAWLQPGKFPLTEALFKAIEAESKVATEAAKKAWQRPRPYHVAPDRFKDAIEHEDPKHFSYPSGHSTRGTLFALVLAELYPDKRAELLAKGYETGWLRVEGGVHYPSDVFAGRLVGQTLARTLLQTPSFQHDLAAVRAELAAGAKP